jgi:hypothetical protein
MRDPNPISIKIVQNSEISHQKGKRLSARTSKSRDTPDIFEECRVLGCYAVWLL